MYLNNLVVAIKKLNGDTLRESNVNQDSTYLNPNRRATVYLPFESEYVLFIKNNAATRAVVSISIDGTDVLGGHQLVISPFSERNIERFILDGNLNKGRRFKFVSLNSPAVQNPQSPANGLIEISCQWEWTPPYTVWYTPFTITTAGAYGSNYRAGRMSGVSSSFVSAQSFSAPELHAQNCIVPDSCSMIHESAAAESQKGATVEGRESNQSFHLTSVGTLNPEITTLRFQLLAPASADVPITVKETRTKHCIACNQLLPSVARYCSSCGVEQVIVV